MGVCLDLYCDSLVRIRLCHYGLVICCFVMGQDLQDKGGVRGWEWDGMVSRVNGVLRCVFLPTRAHQIRTIQAYVMMLLKEKIHQK